MTARIVLAFVLAACSKQEPTPAPAPRPPTPTPAPMPACAKVVEHVAKLTLNPFNYAAGRAMPDGRIAEVFAGERQRKLERAVKATCGDPASDAYPDCTKKLVLDEMTAECVDEKWGEAHLRCLVAAKNDVAVHACDLTTKKTVDVAQGSACLTDIDCGTMRCIEWTTEGGMRRATCEIPCGPKPGYACPPGTGCVHQGGGPSGVCLKR